MQHHPNTVERVFREGWQLRWKRTRNSRDTYRTVEELCELLGRLRPVADVSVADVTRLFLNWQERGLSNARINRKIAVLRPRSEEHTSELPVTSLSRMPSSA